MHLIQLTPLFIAELILASEITSYVLTMVSMQWQNATNYIYSFM